MSKETREYAKQLVSQMTLEEKMSQMVYQSPAIERLGIPAYNWWNEALHGVARAGVATVFPQAIGLAATFDKELLQEIGDVVSTEGLSLIHIYLANLWRMCWTPQCCCKKLRAKRKWKRWMHS